MMDDRWITKLMHFCIFGGQFVLQGRLSYREILKLKLWWFFTNSPLAVLVVCMQNKDDEHDKH